MYTLMLCPAVGLFFAIIFASCGTRNTDRYVVSAFCGLVGGLLCSIVIGGIVLPFMLPMKDVVYGPRSLMAMRGSDGVSGIFVWGSGSIESGANYNFQLRMEDGSMALRSLPANDIVRFIEDAALQDTGSWSTTVSEVDKTSSLYVWAMDNGSRNRIVRQEFRVPVGTVVQPLKAN